MSPRRPSRDPGVEHEPHLAGTPCRADPSESKADRSRHQPTRDDDQSVWDEPALSPDLAGSPDADATWSARLLRASASMATAHSWRLALLLSLAGGPFAVIGAFFGYPYTGALYITTVIIFAPALEELVKVALPIWVVEKRPSWFIHPAQIIFCGAMAGLVFAVIENLIYLFFYVPDPSPTLVIWRWTVCVLLHVSCSVVASIGLARVWRDTWVRLDRPRLRLAYPWQVAAVLIHGAYNAFAVSIDLLTDTFK